MPYILQTNGLTKRIGSKMLIDNVNLHIRQGEIYGFLGPNGAGKTTIMKMITNLWKPTFGTIELFGETLTTTSYEVLKRMGSIIEFPTFYEQLSAKENLELHCEYMGYYNPGCVEETLQLLELHGTGDQPVKSFSLGMKQRLGIARAILTRPELLILDEPTNGLDPAGLKQIMDLFKRLCQEYGMTIMISSHLLAEIESIADTIGVLQHGRLIKEVAMQEITRDNLSYIELHVGNPKKAAYILSDKLNLTNFKLADDNCIRIYDMQISSQNLTKTLATNDIDILSIGRKSDSLEDYFLKMTMEEGQRC